MAALLWRLTSSVVSCRVAEIGCLGVLGEGVVVGGSQVFRQLAVVDTALALVGLTLVGLGVVDWFAR